MIHAGFRKHGVNSAVQRLGLLHCLDRGFDVYGGDGDFTADLSCIEVFYFIHSVNT